MTGFLERVLQVLVAIISACLVCLSCYLSSNWPCFESCIPVFFVLTVFTAIQISGTCILERHRSLLVGIEGAVLLLLSVVFLGGFSLGAQWFYLPTAIAISIVVWLEVFANQEKEDSLVKRKRFRMAIIAHNLSCVACSCVLFVELILAYRASDYTAKEIPLLIVFACYLLTGAWLYSLTLTASNPFFFSQVCIGRSQFDDLSELTESVLSDGKFILTALTMPSALFRRIKETISPGSGSYHVKTEYEFLCQDWMKNNGEICIDVPLILFGYIDLTNMLSIKADGSLDVYRVGDAESRELLCCALSGFFEARGVPPELACGRAAQFIEVVYSTNPVRGLQADAALRKECDEWIGEDKALQGFLSALLVSLLYVKPTIVHVAGKPSKTGVITLTVERDVALVPIRMGRNGRMAEIRAGIVRLFTKRRMRFYFGLGNADCAQTYHLAFSGPPGTYLSVMELECVGNASEFFIAEEMQVTNRYDQDCSRVYIRNGHGFSRCALVVGYEEQKHRSITALSATSLVCFLTLFAMAFMYVFPVVPKEPSLDEKILPLIVLGFGGVMSIWEAMETYRAEEWIWLGATVSIILSFVAMAHFIWLFLPSNANPTVWDKWIWTGFLAVSFLVMELSVMALFERIKQHGRIMDKVPYTRVAPACSKQQGHFLSCLKELENDLKADPDGEYYDVLFNSADQDVESSVVQAQRYGGRKQYDSDIKLYRPLYGALWTDGWLVPSWAGAFNPSNAPAGMFCTYAHDVLKGCDDSSDVVSDEVSD